MEWRDDGIILGTRRHGETSVILEVMTRRHGRHLGLVRGGRSRRMQPVLQAGNSVDLVWRARLDEHLGFFSVELLDMKAAGLMETAAALYGLQLCAAHLRLLPERDPHPGLFETLGVVIDHLDHPRNAAELVVRLELLMLEELGFGLDLERCAATGSSQDLAYVSPRSGRAVSRDAGAPWRDRLLPMPAFLRPASGLRADADAIDEAFRLSAFFLARNIYEPRGIEPPDARAGFLAAVRRSFQQPDDNGEHAA